MRRNMRVDKLKTNAMLGPFSFVENKQWSLHRKGFTPDNNQWLSQIKI
jgi:hypothetical protein